MQLPKISFRKITVKKKSHSEPTTIIVDKRKLQLEKQKLLDNKNNSRETKITVKNKLLQLAHKNSKITKNTGEKQKLQFEKK